MEQYVNPGRVDGPILGAVVVDAFTPGATIQTGATGKPQVINGRDVLYPPPDGWDQILTTGTVTLLVWRSPLRKLPNGLYEGPGPRSGSAFPPATQTSEFADCVNVPAGAAVQLLAPNPNRRRAIIQNLSTQAVPISRDPGMANAPAAGSKIEAVLAACAVAGDGSGGSIEFDGWAGAVYARVAAGASLVGVEAF